MIFFLITFQFMLFKLFIFSFLFFNFTKSAEEGEGMHLKKIALTAATAASIYLATAVLHKGLQTETSFKNFFSTIKTKKFWQGTHFNPYDFCYAATAGAHIGNITNDKSDEENKKNCKKTLIPWIVSSLVKTLKENQTVYEIGTPLSMIPLILTAPIKADKSSWLISKEKSEQNILTKLPFQRLKSLYFSSLFWIVWKIYQEKTFKINFKNITLSQLLEFYQYGLLIDFLADDQSLENTIKVFIIHFLLNLKKENYNPADFFKTLGSIVGAAFLLKPVFLIFF